MNVILQSPNVDFLLDENKKNPGVFSLMNNNKTYFFEWVPKSLNDSSKLLERNIPKKVTCSINQITKIICVEHSLFAITLEFILYTNSKFPKFYFHQHSYIFVFHLLELLEHKKLIVRSKNNNKEYIVNIPFEQMNEIDNKNLLSPDEIVAIAEHNKILKALGYKSNITKQNPVIMDDFHGYDFSQIKRLIFQEGIKSDVRPYLWSLLFGVVPFSNDKKLIDDHFKAIQNQYVNIKKQFQLLTKSQHKSTSLIDILRIIDNDVKRNDRKFEAFQDDDSPNLLILKNVLLAYLIYNRDVGYVQGLNDLISLLILLFIKNHNAGKVIFYDNSIKTILEAETFIFWNFVGLMEVTQHERLFTDLANNQKFVLQRTAVIATTYHPPLKKLLASPELSELSFLFRPFLLLFKRAFKVDDLFRLWDAIFTSNSPQCFIRFVGAAILIIIFPKLLIQTDQSLGEVMLFADCFMEKVSIDSVLNLAAILMNKFAKPHPLHDYVYELIPVKDMYKLYTPKYMALS